MTFREEAVVRLLVFLISFLGRKIEGFYSTQLSDIVNGLTDAESEGEE